MLSITTDMREKQGLDPNKYYEAEVLENDDHKYHPDGRYLGRIQARVSVIFDGIPDAELPWAIPAWSHSGGANELSGSFAVPKKGTKVMLQFQQGNPSFPRYTGYHVDVVTQMEEVKHHYPNRIVTRFSNKALMVLDTEDDVLYLRNPGNVKIYVDGNVEIEVRGDIDEKIHGSVRREILGNLHETVHGYKHIHTDGHRTESTGGTTDVYSGGKFTIESAANMAIEGGEMIYENCGQQLGDPERPKLPKFGKWLGIPGGCRGTNSRPSLSGKTGKQGNSEDSAASGVASNYSGNNGKVTYGDYTIKQDRSAPVQTPHED